MAIELLAQPEQIRTPGRPRSSASQVAIMEATLDLLGDGKTMRNLTIEEISGRRE